MTGMTATAYTHIVRLADDPDPTSPEFWGIASRSPPGTRPDSPGPRQGRLPSPLARRQAQVLLGRRTRHPQHPRKDGDYHYYLQHGRKIANVGRPKPQTPQPTAPTHSIADLEGQIADLKDALATLARSLENHDQRIDHRLDGLARTLKDHLK